MTQPSVCPDPGRLTDLLRGRLSLSEVEPLARHLEGCPACAQAAEHLGAEDPLAETVRGQTLPEPDPDAAEINRLIESLCQLATATPDETAASGSFAVRPLLAGLRGPTDTAWDAAALLTPPDRPGELGRLGPYRVVAPLGAGGMGMVYLARQAHPDRAVALKILGSGPRGDAGRLARFRAEADAAARLAHPNIIPIYEAGEHDGLPFIAMEFAAGGNLAQRLARTPLPPRDAAGLIEPLARAIAYAHSRGILHRDLKPSNILLSPESRVTSDETGSRSSLITHHSSLATPKIGDFGLAKLLDAEPGTDAAGWTQTGAPIGTPAYMAPEQATGAKDIGPAADVYGLGAILYECLTGRPPFTAATVVETLEQVRTQEPVPPALLQPGVPRDLQTICLKCLEKQPGRRYASAAELADDLGRFLRGEPVRARPVGVATRVRKWAIRRPTAAALLATCVVSVAALAIVTAVYTTRLRESAAEARRQQALATGNYRAARDALRQMLARLEERRAAEIPRLKELRQEQLEHALAFYTSVLGQTDDPDPEARLDAALVRVEVGTIQYDLGRRSSAAATFQLAAAQLEQLPAGYRTRSTTRVYLIQCYNYLANLGDGGADEAEGYFLKALAEATEHAADDPADPARHKLVAAAEHNLGTLFQNQRRPDRAEQHYLRALDILTRLTGQHPGTEAFAVSRAETLLNLGLIYLHTDRAGPAGVAFRDAEALLQPLVNAHPGHERYALSLAGVHINWGNLLRFSGDLPGAIARFDRAVELADVVLKREPEYITARERATESHGARAFALSAAGRARDAIPDWDVVIEFVDPASRNRYRVVRAVALAAGGWHDRAAAEANEVAAAPGLSDEARYDLACALSLAAEAARTDPALGYFGRTARVESRAAAAVAVLRQLHAAGFFRQPAVAKHLGEDPDLKPLHDRPAFRQLLAEVGQEK